MHDRQLYAKIMGIESPWSVTNVELDTEQKQVRVTLAVKKRKKLPCPECGKKCSKYDTRKRRWRHLDTCHYQTILVASVPRVDCPEHKVRQVKVPWAESGSRFTVLLEALAIDWLREASTSAIADILQLSWDEVDGIMQRAVARGLERRESALPVRIAVDEKAFGRGQDYVTIVSDQREGTVLYVAEKRTQSSLDSFYEQFEETQLAQVECVAMDMWQPYIASTVANIPDGATKIAFDKFHIAQHLGDAVDKVRWQENKQLMKEGDERLKGTKYLWLTNPDHMSDESWNGEFKHLRQSKLRTARSWALKETAMELWSYKERYWAEKAWKRWYGWAIRSRLEPMKRVARMIKRHWDGVINAVVTKVTNAGAEGINSAIQRIKSTACGFRNRRRFKNAIYFHLGGLNLYPTGIDW